MTLGKGLVVMMNTMKMMICLLFAASIPPVSALAQKGSVKNVVIVHGAFADGSGWEGVFNILSKRGYKVTIAQNPLTSLEDDVATTLRALERQDGPVILVGHSHGGTVITQAGVSSKVKALVYVAAFVPDVGESTLNLLTSREPNSVTLPADENGFIYYDKSKFRSGFAAEQSEKKAAFMYASQQPLAAKALMTPLTAAAWKIKPSYGIVATEDRSINPDLERSMYLKARAKVFEVRGSHTVYMSNPKAVAKVIQEAASCVSKRSFIKRIFKKRNDCD